MITVVVDKGDILGVLLALVFAAVAGRFAYALSLLLSMGGSKWRSWLEDWSPLVALAAGALAAWGGWETAHWFTAT